MAQRAGTFNSGLCLLFGAQLSDLPILLQGLLIHAVVCLFCFGFGVFFGVVGERRVRCALLMVSNDFGDVF